MTTAEFNAALSRSRSTLRTLTAQTMAKLKEIYEEAAGKAAQLVMHAELNELSDLTSGLWRQIQSQLEQAAADIRDRLEVELSMSVGEQARKSLGVTETFLLDLVDDAEGKITRAGILNMVIGVDRQFVESMVNRIYSDGYTFSDRVWRVGEAFQTQIKDIITTGAAAGRDAVDIAKDIEVYVKSDRRGLARRWGDLVKGTPDWSRRIRKNIDFNALRLVRSEMGISWQQSTVLAGQMNPAALDLFDWIRHTSEDWNCRCPRHERNSPYTAAAVPGYPHPSCLCEVRPRLRDGREFSADLRRWVRGEEVGYLDDWYGTYYTA